MAKKERQLLKRRIAQADLHLREALLRLKDVYEAFEGHHSNLDEALLIAIQGMIASRQVLEAFWKQAWGDTWDSRNSYLGHNPNK